MKTMKTILALSFFFAAHSSFAASTSQVLLCVQQATGEDFHGYSFGMHSAAILCSQVNSASDRVAVLECAKRTLGVDINGYSMGGDDTAILCRHVTKK